MKCQNCGGKIAPPERVELGYRFCLLCAEAGHYDRATVLVTGQHKGPNLVVKPSTVSGLSLYDRG